VGPLGLFQPLADFIKLLLTEVIINLKANKFLYILAPVVVFVFSLIA
jgi:NADH-quinone oxidoreductase subunit H